MNSSHNTDGINKLSEISGLSTCVIGDIVNQVLTNNKKLNSCKLHNFDIPCNKRWECVNCGGIVDTLIKRWYEKGIIHGELK